MQRFPYHRSLSPTLGVLLALAIGEAMVVHGVAIALWGWRVAILLGMLDLALVIALIALLRDIRRLPVLIDGGVLTMRIGRLASTSIPLDRVRGLRAEWDAAALKQKDVANFALANWPNVVVDLIEPVKIRRRRVRAIAHKLDDPAAFAAALTAAAMQ